MSKLPDQGTECLNCGSTLQGPYCSACGQKALDKKRESFWMTMGHFIGDFVHFDSQIFRTALPLLFKPGFLSNEYLAGKRVGYFNPIRMYVFLSFLFFFLYFTMDKPQVLTVDPGMNGKAYDSLMQTLQDPAERSPFQITIDSSEYRSLASYDSAQTRLPIEKRDGFIKSSFIRKGFALKERYDREGRMNLVSALFDNFMHNIPKLAFVLLPFFALLLKLFFRKSRMYYVEHLIVSVYFYDFFYLFGSLILLLSWLIRPWAGFFSSLQFYGVLLYFLLMIRRVYENSWLRSVLKLFLFGVSFSVLLALAFLINMVAVFWSV